MRHVQQCLPVAIAVALCACGGGTSSDRDAAARREAEFEKLLTNATLEGRFTSSRSGELKEDKYTISSVTRLPGGIWTINTRIQYGDHDVTVPVPVKVVWAGDTPVITLTDLDIPKMGTFTARVMFFRDRYAGLWWHGSQVGGQMFGQVTHGDAAPASEEKTQP
ncbi:MAG: hypothetical protein R2729_27315 [Bryobacteraceae bacterium]